jgi:Fe-S-cluster containining protein
MFSLYELVEAMPQERRAVIKDRFRRGREHFAKLGWFDRFDQMTERAKEGRSDELAREFISLLTSYIGEQVACPFLEDESCSIYDSRPLTCREYLVTSPAANCRDPRPDNTRKLPISGSVSKAFAELTKTENSEKPSSLLMIRLFEFAETHIDKFDEKIGPAWADNFFRLLTNRKEPGMPEKEAGPPAAAGA